METWQSVLLMCYQLLEGVVLFFIPRRFRYKRIDNDTVLITGGGSGLGRSMAIRFARHGVRKVVLWDLNESGLNESAKLVEQNGAKCWTYVVDVTDRFRVYQVAKQVLQDTASPVTILVNNAGVVSGQKILDLPDEKIIKTFEVNAISHFWVNLKNDWF